MNSSQKPKIQSKEKMDKVLNNDVKKISGLEIPHPVKALGLAALYMEHKLHQDAISVLQELIDSDISIAEIFFALGEIHENSDSDLQAAKENYKKALALASQVAIAAKVALAKIEARENLDAANKPHQEVTNELQALAQVAQSYEMEKRVSAFVREEEQFLFLNVKARCGECNHGNGYKFFGVCNPC